MTTIVTIAEAALISNSRVDINGNFASILANKVETSVIDIDTALAANSDALIPSQRAIKAYVNGQGNNLAPTGAVMPYAGSSAPTGWLLADGTAVSRATYATLFGIISTVYGAGNGTTTFNVPNMKGLVPAGYDATQTEFNALAKTGGEKTHTQTIAELAAHTHPLSASISAGGANPNGLAGASSRSSDIIASSVGSSTPFNVLQPYLTLQYIIKT